MCGCGCVVSLPFKHDKEWCGSLPQVYHKGQCFITSSETNSTSQVDYVVQPQIIGQGHVVHGGVGPTPPYSSCKKGPRFIV